MKTLASLRKNSRHRRHQRNVHAALRTAAALAFVLPTAQLAHAQTYTWNTGTTLTNWSDGGAWAGGAAPVQSPTTTLIMTLNDSMGATKVHNSDRVGTRNDLSDPFMINNMIVDRLGAHSDFGYSIIGNGIHFSGNLPYLQTTNSNINFYTTTTSIWTPLSGYEYGVGKYSIYDSGFIINTVNNGANITFNGRIVGDGSITKIGSGSLELKSWSYLDVTDSFFTGPDHSIGFTGLNVQQGRVFLRAQSDDSTYAPSVFTPDNIKVASGALLGADTGFVLNANRGIRLEGAGARIGNMTIPGTISGATSDSGIIVNYGLLTLNGANTFTGITDITTIPNLSTVGQIKLGNAFALQNSTVNLGGGVLDLNNFSTVTLGGLSGSNNFILFNNSLVLGRNDAIYTGNLAGNGGVTITRGGTQTFTNRNDYAGDTAITNGKVALGTNGALPNSSVVVGANGTLIAQGNNRVGSLHGVAGSNLVLQGSLATNGNNNNTAFNGTISGGGSLVKEGTGGLTLSGDNTYTGRTIVNGGILAISKDANLGLVNSFDAAHLQLNGNATLLLVGTPELFANRGLQISGTGNVIDRDNLNGGVVTFFNPISGSGEFAKTGVGAIHLRAAGTFSGVTNLNQGELRILDGNALQNSTVSLNGGLLDITKTGTVTLGGLAGSGNLNQGSTFLRIGNNNQDTTYSGVLSGDGYLEKVGTGKTTLTGMNTRTFNVGISEGTLAISSDQNLGILPAPLPFGIGINGGTLEINNAPYIHPDRGIVIGANGGTIRQTGQTLLYSPIIGAGKLIKDGEGTSILLGTGTWDGGTEVRGGTLDVRQATGLPSGTNLTVGAGATLRTNDQSFLFGSLNGEGTIDAGTPGVFLGGLDITVGSGDASGNFGGTILLNGKLVKVGTGTQTFGGTIATGAGTEVQEGTMVLNGMATGGITVKSGATLAGNAGMDTLSLEAGGILSPGNSPGYIHALGDFTWAGGSTIDFDLGSSGDYILTENNLVKAGSGSYLFNFSTMGDFMDGTYNLIGFVNGTNFSATDFSYTGLPSGAHATFSIAAPYLSLTVSGVGAASAPEPGTLAFALLGGTLILLKRKKN